MYMHSKKRKNGPKQFKLKQYLLKQSHLKEKIYNFVLCGLPYLLLFQEVKERRYKVKQDDSETSASDLTVYKCEMIFHKN